MVERVVVIGAGVYGAAVAASLTRRGARASGATFSWTNSCGKQPRPYHDLSVASMEAHRRLAAGVPHSDWYHEGGNLEWAADDAGREQLRKKVTGVLDYGYEARWLSRAEALRLEPDIDPAQLPADEIAYFPREGWVEPTRLIGQLLSHDAVSVSDTGELGVEPSAVETVLAAGRALYPAMRDATVESVRVGERPIPGDGLPVLGRVVELPNFHFAVSHSGATLSVHAGDLVAAGVLGEDRGDALAAFRFERRSLGGGLATKGR